MSDLHVPTLSFGRRGRDMEYEKKTWKVGSTVWSRDLSSTSAGDSTYVYVGSVDRERHHPMVHVPLTEDRVTISLL